MQNNAWFISPIKILDQQQRSIAESQSDLQTIKLAE